MQQTSETPFESFLIDGADDTMRTSTWSYFTHDGKEYRTRDHKGKHQVEEKTFLTENSSSKLMENAARGAYPINDITVHGGGYYCYLLEGWKPVRYEDILAQRRTGVNSR